MRDEYNIKKLNPRENPYAAQLKYKTDDNPIFKEEEKRDFNPPTDEL